MKVLAALVSGVLFGLGLALSGMLRPARVLGLLNVTGRWDPRLAFVLAGAVCVSALGYRLSHRMPKPVFASHFDIPANRQLDLRLLAGASLFGIGWGLGGFCPGPAIASLSLGLRNSVGFVLAMLVGTVLHGLLGRASAAAGPQASLPKRAP